VSAAPIDEVVDLARSLRLPHVRREAPELLQSAKAQRWEPAEAVRQLLQEELAGRQRSSVRSRRKAAGFPAGKTFDAWDDEVSSIPAPTLRSLRTLEWIGRHENLVVCGPSGTGKSHLLEALGHAAIDAGCHVSWFSLEALGALVRRHRADDSVGRVIKRVLRAELIVIDLCRPRDYPDTRWNGPVVGGERPRVVGIVTGCRGRQGACRQVDSGRWECRRSSCVEGPAP
jgi:DNA replication protein DnaC